MTKNIVNYIAETKGTHGYEWSSVLHNETDGQRHRVHITVTTLNIVYLFHSGKLTTGCVYLDVNELH